MTSRIIHILAMVALLAPISALAQSDRPGAGVDARGLPAFDPSENVKALSEAANKRQDDLRAAAEKYMQAQIEAAQRINELRAIKLDDEAKLRAEYAAALAMAEAKRIDAIRAVDVNAVAVASQRASDQATVLATQVAQSAEALRALVATTAATVAASQQQLANTLSARLTTLEQAGYTSQGKQTVSDPAFISLQSDVRALTASRSDIAGVVAGRSDVIGWIAFGIMALIAAAAAFAAFRSKSDPILVDLLKELKLQNGNLRQ
jgi:hypothetical protein